MTSAPDRPASVVVLGGTSDIARALLRLLVADGYRRVVLAGRDTDALARAATELTGAGADYVASVAFDANDVTQAGPVVDSCFQAIGRVDLVVVAVGLLYDDADAQDPERVARCITVNFTWPAAALSRVAGHLRDQGSGRVVVLSTAAGVRVRRSDYLYGSAKAGLDAFARALNQTLAVSGASLTVVRPGFVRSKMTEGHKPAPLASTPDAVARDIVNGLARGAPVGWSPRGLRFAFSFLNLVPEAIWRRLPI